MSDCNEVNRHVDPAREAAINVADFTWPKSMRAQTNDDVATLCAACRRTVIHSKAILGCAQCEHDLTAPQPPVRTEPRISNGFGQTARGRSLSFAARHADRLKRRTRFAYVVVTRRSNTKNDVTRINRTARAPLMRRVGVICSSRRHVQANSGDETHASIGGCRFVRPEPPEPQARSRLLRKTASAS